MLQRTLRVPQSAVSGSSQRNRLSSFVKKIVDKQTQVAAARAARGQQQQQQHQPQQHNSYAAAAASGQQQQQQHQQQHQQQPGSSAQHATQLAPGRGLSERRQSLDRPVEPSGQAVADD